MPKNSVRSGIVIALLLGTLALAVPYVSTTVDAWLFAETAPPRSKWKTQRPAEDKLKPTGNPNLLPPGKQLAHEQPAEADRAAPLAFDYQEAAPLDRHAVEPVQHEQPATPPVVADRLTHLQEEIQALGAVYLTVEQDGDRFECRSLLPLSPQSSYQKAFSAIGSTPESSLEQVLAEIRNWQRAQQR